MVYILYKKNMEEKKMKKRILLALGLVSLLALPGCTKKAMI